MRVVVALGGNALIRRGQRASVETQRQNARTAAKAITDMIEAGHEIILTHGDGPQIGIMALQDAAYDPALASPMDVLAAEAEGMIGYLLMQELQMTPLLDGKVAALLTRIEVDPDDPAFANPTKPIGPVYNRQEADKLAARHGWKMLPDGDGFRRGVASPRPLRILEIGIVDLLVSHGITVICAGGGGIPVVRGDGRNWTGVEAVIDKDFASALLASQTSADALVMLTDVEGVYAGWGTAEQSLIANAMASELNAHDFAAGSMRPKVEAAIEFTKGGGKFAGIGRLKDGLAILEGRAGTRIVF
jgi:carbamate kinase